MQFKSMSVSAHHLSDGLNIFQKLGSLLGVAGVVGLVVFWYYGAAWSATDWLIGLTSIFVLGTGVYIYGQYYYQSVDSKNIGVFHQNLTNKGWVAWLLGIMLTAFYVLLYWYPEVLGYRAEGGNIGLVALFDPLSQFLKGQPASQWFVYGAMYTFIILMLGVKFIIKYRHNKYQVYRTISIMFFQTAIAFILPEIMLSLNLPYYDLKNIWPLNYYFFFDWNIQGMIQAGTLGYFMLFWGIISFLVLTPLLTYFFGKRWYCSWVCGCGGLAETAGDSFRHLSDKSTKAWRIEKWMIHAVLVFAVVMTIAVLVTQLTGFRNLFILDSGTLSSWYGFFIGAAFSGVVGVGFYPILGSRVWCRFGCPMAAYLGILQAFSIKLPWKKEPVAMSKFRITTNGSQCISCGNCSTYCEMGIDVKSYAQKQEDIVRASCVGCGVCSAVCPRGVLKLENL